MKCPNCGGQLDKNFECRRCGNDCEMFREKILTNVRKIMSVRHDKSDDD
jgi:hypothetical protein